MIDFLNAKPLYYEQIDYDRFPRIFNAIKKHLSIPKIIHIVGTNGKGTTGRFLATALKNRGFFVGHYTSPHIVNFNERIWLDGDSIADRLLQNSFLKLQKILNKEQSEALSYFEYTTLLAIVAFGECDYVVFEAGLGGEFDATAVFDNILTLITPIAYDHQAFLGSDIKAIATTKLRAIKHSAIMAKQGFSEVLEVARSLDKTIKSYDEFLDGEDLKNIKSISLRLNLPSYQEQNLALAIAALHFLGISYDENSFDGSRLFGRFSRVLKNVIVDVGHNVLAANAIAKELKDKKIVLVYNSLKDKDFNSILKTLRPNIKRVEIIKIDTIRSSDEAILRGVLDNLGINYSDFKEIKDDEEYLVFGSFSVVEAFMRYINFDAR